MNSAEFRKELEKIMPGYDWTVHRKRLKTSPLEATGIQSSGFNRLSTLEVARYEGDERIEYSVRSSGYGLRSPWLSEYRSSTLARALRGLQNHYETMAAMYRRHENDLEFGRKKHNQSFEADGQKDGHRSA